MLIIKNTAPSGALSEGLARNEIPMVLCASKETAACGSRIGGRPDVPAGFVWPEFETEICDGESARLPLSFLCQIRLSEVAAFDRDGVLPEKGLLSFFYEISSLHSGYDPDDRGAFRVYYFEDADSLAPADFPDGLKEERIVKEFGLSFSSGDSYPAYEELCFHSDTDCTWDAYDALLEAKGCTPESGRCKLLGYADLIQGEMLSVCARASEGIAWGNSEKPVGSPAEWTLLFQMASIYKDGYRLLFGDDGDLYFFIRKEDLQSRRFDKAWLMVQCY